MKENTKRYVKLSIILYIVILCVALVGTLAWFIYDKSAIVSTEDNAKITVGDYMEIKLKSDSDWSSEIRFGDNVQYPDVSLNPETKEVWYPTSLDADDNLWYGEDGKGKYKNVTDEDGYFAKIELEVRASKGMSVYLHRDSSLKGNEITETEGEIITKNAIAGAARVAFYDAESENFTMLWVPNSTYEYVGTDENDNPKVNVAGTPEESYNYIKVENNIVASADAIGAWSNVSTNNLATDTEVGEAIPILEFEEAGQVKDLTIYIWIEGTDRESKTPFSGGILGYSLKLIGLPKSAATDTAAIDDIVFKNGELVYSSTGKVAGGEVLYSYDNENWTTYNATNPDLAKKSEVLYVRMRETATELAGPVKEIALNV